MIYRITIPDFRPTPDNKLVKTHWAVAHKHKQADVQMVGVYARLAAVPHALGKRRVSLEITLTGRQKKTDPWAYLKSLLDALVKARMLVDDTEEFVKWGGTTYKRAAKGIGMTVIVLEDLED